MKDQGTVTTSLEAPAQVATWGLWENPRKLPSWLLNETKGAPQEGFGEPCLRAHSHVHGGCTGLCCQGRQMPTGMPGPAGTCWAPLCLSLCGAFQEKWPPVHVCLLNLTRVPLLACSHPGGRNSREVVPSLWWGSKGHAEGTQSSSGHLLLDSVLVSPHSRRPGKGHSKWVWEEYGLEIKCRGVLRRCIGDKNEWSRLGRVQHGKGKVWRQDSSILK